MVGFLMSATAISAFALDVQKDIVEKSLKYVGTPYKTGGTAPPVFDCSGFVGFILKPHVPGIPRVSRDMAKTYPAVEKSRLVPGDLVFFSTGMVQGAVTHVALYIGDGKIVHAISDGPETGVVVTDLERRYWKNHYHSSARVLAGGASSAVKAPAAIASKPSAGGAKPAADTASKPSAGGAKPAADTAPKPSAGGSKPAAAAAPKPAAGAKPAADTAQSPWDTWDGYIEGDYALWKNDQDAKFDQSKAAYDESSEKDRFEEWKQGKN